jgi:hypothetical protein
MLTFMARALAGDHEAAAQCLDLGRLAADRRRAEGARLACAVQRLGYVYSQDVPVDPARPPYTWYSGREGVVVCERVKQEQGPDRWAFSQATVAGIDSLWEQVRRRPVDVRWVILRSVVRLPEQAPRAGQPPAGLPADFRSPRAMLRGFLRAVDDAEHDDSILEQAAGFLDLSEFPREEARRLGPRLAEKLEVVLHKIRPALADLPDHWTAPPVVLGDRPPAHPAGPPARRPVGRR